jgi:hypothetical protein
MAAKFPIKGYWFLPNQEENKIAGILNVEEDRFRLELFGSLSGNSHAEFLDSIEWEKSTVTPLILGFGADGKYYSLLNSIAGGGSQNFGADFPLTSFNVDNVICGCLLERDEKIFTKIWVEYSHLQEWLGFTGVSPHVFKESSVTLNYLMPAPIKISISDEIKLTFGYTWNGMGSTRYIQGIAQTCYLKVESKTAVSYRELCRSINLFRDFLSLATLSEISIDSTSMSYDLNIPESESDRHTTVELFLDPPSSKSTKEKPFFKFLFQYDDVKEILPDVLRKWFFFDEDILPIRRYLVASIKPIKVFEVNHFLNVAQALEGFHSRFRKEEGSFKTWLTKLLDEFDTNDLIKQEFADRDTIIKAARDSRHYYSHFYKLRNDSTKYGRELFDLTKKLRILLVCCVLKETGLDDVTINNVMTVNKL